MNQTRAHIQIQIGSILVLAITCIFNVCAGNVTYSYDSLNRLTNVDYGNGSVISYNYDPAGNRLTYSAVVSSDTTPPTIVITSPTTGPGYTNTTATINLSGTASDNVGVTLVTWQNYSGGLGVATGTNSWSITGIPLKPGANVISVTAYDAAGNSTPATLTVSFATGGTGTTTSTVFTETGSGSTIDPTKWTTSGSTVTESGGMMQVLTTVTDGGGLLTSLPIPINSTGDITISRNVLVHYANANYVGDICMEFGNTPWAAVFYANATYSGTGDEPRYGTFIGRNTDVPAGAHFNCIEIGHNADTSAAFPVLWDTWFSEKIIYSPTTGYLQYFVNGQQFTNYFIGIMPPTNNPTLQLGFRAWGWNTGHEELFSNLVVSQIAPASVSAPLSQIAGYSRLANGVFRLTMNGPVGSNYVIYASSDLKYWTPLYTNTVPPAGLITFVDPSASGYPQRFYRAVPLGTAVTVVPPPPTPQLTGISVTAGGQFEFYLNGPVGSNYVVQVSSNLVNWVNLETNAIPGGGVNVYDFPIQKTQSQIFYRALPVP
jgi:YD repeat-containing protein